MVESQLVEEEVWVLKPRDVGTETQKGPTGPVLQTQATPSPPPAFVKENIGALRTMIKEHDSQTKAKTTPRKLVYADSEREASDEFMTRNVSDRLSLESSGTSNTHGKAHSASKSQKSLPKGKEPSRPRRSRSSDTGYEEGSKDIDEDLNSPYKRPKPTPFTPRIARFKYHLKAKLPRNVRVYEGNKDPEDHLSIFSVAAEQEEWPIYSKDPTEIHDIKQRQNEGLQTFMDQFKSESSHIKGVPPVLCISTFMHGHGHPELAKKLNDKILKMVDEMFERFRAFIRGEVAAGLAEMVRILQKSQEN
ncbi:hypothetical protein Tco_1421537, partial [Tanacetum coccineum]